MPARLVVSLVLPDGFEVLAGTLLVNNVRSTESSAFQYDTGYLADPRAYPLDPELPLVDWPIHASPGRALFRCFNDSTPDRWGRALLERAATRAEDLASGRRRSLLEVDYLLGVHDETRQGALRFAVAPGEYRAGDDDGVPRMVDLERLLALSDDLARDPAADADLHDLIAAGSSLGGARPKASVRDDDGTLLIAKFPNPAGDEWDVPGWESLTLDLARDAGIDVPPHRLVEIGGRNVLLLERFDRVGARRIGYMSAITLSQATDGERGTTMVDVADFFEREAASADTDLPEMLRRALFSLVVSNTDNHLRNHGFLRVADGWRLSPAFDVNPNPGPVRFATELGAGSTVADALAWSDVFRVERSRASEMLAEIVETVAGWRRRAIEAGLPGREIRLMSGAFESALGREAQRLVATA